VACCGAALQIQKILFSGGGLAMAETKTLSVEKVLEKLRSSNEPKSTNTRLDEKIDELDEDIKRMRAQRLRLERHQRRSTKKD
jgi:TolA-binding protein